MTQQKNSSLPTPSLSDLIEIIRDPQPPEAVEVSFPPDLDNLNPLHALSQLVEKLDSIVSREPQSDEFVPQASSADHAKPHQTTSDVERYIELLQKQRDILKKVLPSLH